MNIVFKASDNVKEKIIDYYQDKTKEKKPPYSVFQASEADTTVTLYESGKVMFQGISADIDANIWIEMEKHLNNRDIKSEENKKDKDKEKDNRYYNYSAIGSDEVGTGDYLGPIVVTAAYVEKSDFEYLISLNMQDSKKMADAKILEIGPKLLEKIPHATLILTNKAYNKYKENDINMNAVKAILHNKVLYKMKDKFNDYEKIIVDQFTYPNSYYSYLKNEENVVRNILFLTKAEDKNLAVACASVISRYIFLLEMKKLEEKYNCIFPKGAGENVDKACIILIEKFGKEILEEISKISFKNTEKILEK